MASKNFNELILKNFSVYAHLPAMMFKQGDACRTLSYGELEDICIRTAAGLMEEGLERGERIVIFARNCPAWAHADLASLLAGAITSAIYASALSDEAEFIINDLEASIVFVKGPTQLEKIRAIRKNIPSVRKVFVLDEEIEGDGSWITPFSSLMRTISPSPERLSRIRNIAETTHGEDPMCIIYTSGTTGRPKGVVLTHNNYINTIDMLLEHISDTDTLKRNLSILPLAHAFERFAGYYLILAMGRCIAYMESLDKIMENFKEMRPNLVVAVPRFFETIHERITEGVRTAPPVKRTMFQWALRVGREVSRRMREGIAVPVGLGVRHTIADLLVFRKVRDVFGGELEFFVSGGAPLSKELAEFFHALGIVILEGWGATEATTPSTLNSPDEFRFGTVGRPLPRVEVRIAADGELEVRGPNVFKEYWNNPEETGKTFTPDGFYRSGDIGEVTNDGWISIVDRKKQLIITSGGRNIAPAPIEILLSSCALVDMAYVHGDGRRYLTALLVPNRNAVDEVARKAGSEKLPWTQLLAEPSVDGEVQKQIDRVNAKLPRFMRIQDFRVLSKPFTIETGEMTHTMKLKRKVIEERYKELLDSMYSPPRKKIDFPGS